MTIHTVEAPARATLTRQLVLRAALAYVDELGLDALSMHKLGARLGVKAMSLYNHVDDKADLLDGLVELLWAEMVPAECVGDLRDRLRGMADGIRRTLRAHPAAASLVMTRQVLPVGALRIFKTYLEALEEAGFTRAQAIKMVRAITGYAFGSALAQSCWSCATAAAASELGRLRQVSQLLPDDVPDDLLAVAMEICGDCDLDGTFEMGLDLMLGGLKAG